jgi:choline dehydrogenase-like flavoprotein
VVVIGAGAAGTIAALRLASAGASVVCLEQGDWTDRGSFPGERPEWELLAEGPWHPSPDVRRGTADYPCETSESEMQPLMFNAVGGSTVIYNGQWPRLLPRDFRRRSLDGTTDDWPIEYSDLAPYYDQVAHEIGIAGLTGDPAYPDGAPATLPPLPLNEYGRVAATGLNQLGWHWWPGPNAIASEPHGTLAACTRRGTCMTGCPEGAKASLDVALWPRALNAGARLVTGARVTHIPVDARGLATGAVYLDREGREHMQRGAAVVLAANGVGTPRLLLLSAGPLFPDGLANRSGLVGRRLMVHPYASATGVYEQPLESWSGPYGHPLHSLEFYETNHARGFDGGAKWAAMPVGGPLAHARLDPDRALCDHHALMDELMGHAFVWGVMAEDLPREDNRVELDPQATDSDGVQAPRIVYRSSENTRRLHRFHLDRATEAHLAAGATRVIETGLGKNTGYHLMGTARMGDDPASSVVDSFGCSHDVPNLHIYDGSVFVTSGGVNPTATITAIAARGTEHMLATASLMPTPA